MGRDLPKVSECLTNAWLVALDVDGTVFCVYMLSGCVWLNAVCRCRCRCRGDVYVFHRTVFLRMCFRFEEISWGMYAACSSGACWVWGPGSNVTIQAIPSKCRQW